MRLRIALVDRWLAGRLLTTFFLVTAAILIVFVVVDLFSNLERLAQQGLARGMLLRYGAQLPEIFLTLSPFLLVLAALWVVVDLQRQNELVPLVALGYSPRRLALPLLAMGVLLAPVVWADRELVLPRVASLEREAAAFRSANWERPRIIPDGEGGVLVARFFDPSSRELRDVSFLQLDAAGREREAYLALRAHPQAQDGRPGWLLQRGEHRALTPDGERLTPLPPEGLWIPSRILLEDVEASIEAPGFLSAAQIRQQLERTPGFRHLRLQLYERFTYPLAGLALLSVCLPLLLNAQGGWDTFLRASGSLGICFAYFMGSTICAEFGRHGALPELVAVLLPFAVTALLAGWVWREG
ncbi:MAG: LptF/LptG family permease [Planctomycetota bacterium]